MPRQRFRTLAAGALTISLPFFSTAPSGAAPNDASRSRGPDPAERGLDLFVHAAPTVIAGDALSVDLIAYGFPSVTVAKPLPSANIVATWDPESLGPNVGAAPADVSVTTDALGHARLDIPVPMGDLRKITLLVALRHGEHVRTRKIEINRAPRTHVDLRVPDASVVPGSHTPAWVTVTDARTGGPVGGAAVDVVLLEGDVDRGSERVVTDATGIARATFLVPPNATGTPKLSLRARLSTEPEANPVQSVVGLGLREETPATPRLVLHWKELQLKPGEIGHAEARLLDATDEPIANHPLTYWTGPKGTTPPANDDEWKKHGKTARTDGLGQFAVETQAPRVVTTLGSDVTIVVRAEVEGETLQASRPILVGQPVATASLVLESGEVVPGIVQRAWLHVSDGERGVTGDFAVEADGLRTKVTTDAQGDAEVAWTVPQDVGAKRDKGPCAGGVAAAVVVRQATPIAALSRHPEPFELCVNVARERSTLLRTSVQVARVGDKILHPSSPRSGRAQAPAASSSRDPRALGRLRGHPPEREGAASRRSKPRSISRV